MGYQLGVDLGTTSTSAAVARSGQASIVQLTTDSQVMPSVISIHDDGEVLCGEVAARRAVTDPTRTIREFKRRFGDPAPIVLGGQGYGADVLTGHLLADVIERTRSTEGDLPAGLALAHPASWGPFRLDMLRSAAAHAGYPDVELVPEPVAAAIANRDRIEPGALVAVYDLGGGTFDAALVRYGDDWDVVGSPEGVERLGGVDFDLAVVAHVDAALDGQVVALDSADPESRAALARLRADCQAAKEALSVDTDVEIPVQLPGLHTTVRLTRVDLEAMVRPRLVDSLGVLDRVVASAGVTWDDVASVLLVGGSSRIPAVAQMVAEHTGRPITAATNPTFAIAVGTALAADAVAADEPAPVAVTEPPPDLPPDPAMAAEAGATPSGSKRRGLVIGLAAAVVAAAVGVGVVVSSGGDDAAPASTAAAAPTAAPGTNAASGTTVAPETTTAATENPATDPAGPADGSITAVACSGVPADGSAAGVGGDVLVTATASDLVGASLAIDATSCSIGAEVFRLALPADIGPVVAVDATADGTIAAATDAEVLVGRVEEGNRAVCAEASENVSLGSDSTMVSWSATAPLVAFEIGRQGCTVAASDLFGGGEVQAASIVARSRVLVGGVTADGSEPTLSIAVGAGLEWSFAPSSAGLTVAAFDGVGRCGTELCGVDVAGDLVVVVTSEGEFVSSSSLADLVGSNVASLRGIGTAGNGSLVLATADTDGVSAITALMP